MGKDSGSTQTTQTTSSDPWSGAQPYIKDVLGKAQGAYNSGSGFDYPNFSTTIPFASQTNQALQGIENTANSGNPLGQASQNAALGIFNNGGLTQYQQQAGAGFGGLASGQQPNGVASNLGGYANGSYVNGGSPQFNQALDTQAAKLGTDVQRNVDAMGRTGSAYNTNELTSQIGDFRNNAMQQEMSREQGQQIQAAGMLSGEQQQGMGNQMSAYGNMANLGSSAASQLGSFAGMAPSIYNQQFAPYQQLGNVGSAYQDQSTRQMQENIDRFNSTQQSPWERLSAYNALIGGAGQLGQSTTTKVPAPSPLQGAIGGGLLGAQLGSSFGPLGTGLGGLGGALLGGLF